MAVEESSHYVHLVDFPAIMSSNRDEVMNGLPPNSGSKGFMKIDFVNLLIAPGNYTGVVDRKRRGVRIGLNFEDPAGSNGTDT